MRRRATILSAVAGMALIGGIAVVPPAAAAETTTITFRVTGCEGCVLQAATTPSGSDDIYNGPKAKVRNGVATMTVPTEQTAGMYFSVDASWPVQINAQPLLVFQYEGAGQGTRVTKAQGRASKRASACWAGTTAGSATIRVTVRRVWQEAFDPGGPNEGGRTQVPMAWVVPTRSALPPFWRTFDGVLATQDSVDCAVPASMQ
jgi:hypothetical protein